jgi:hypothetical protein
VCLRTAAPSCGSRVSFHQAEFDTKGKSSDLPFSLDENVNRKWMVLLCTLAVLPAGGCHSPQSGNVEPVDVIVDGGKPFSADLAGRWRADEDGWEFVLAPDGRIVSARISFGRVVVVPGQTTKVPAKGGGEGVFTPGQWTVHYSPDSAQLTLKIVMTHVRVAMSETVIEGSSTDVFVGSVDAADGLWQARWTTFTRYTAHTPGRLPVDLSTDPTDGETKPLVFRKVADR